MPTFLGTLSLILKHKMSIHRQSSEAQVNTDGLGSPEPAGEAFSEKPKLQSGDLDISKDEKRAYNEEAEPAPIYTDEEGKLGGEGAVETNEDLVTRVIHVEDDPSLNPWTFRVFFLGTRNPHSSCSAV
jgi:hypothetical protein